MRIAAIWSAGFLLACSHASDAPREDAGGRDAAPGEAGMDALDESPGDASEAEAAPPDASSSAWCSHQGIHLFCTDFDEDLLTHSWDGASTQHGAIQLDGSSFTSAPYAFLATSTALVSGAVANVRMGKSVVEMASQLHYHFDVRPDALDGANGGVAVAAIELLDVQGQTSEIIELTLRVSGATLDDYAAGVDGGADFTASHPLSRTPALGQWTRVNLDVAILPADAGATGGTLTVTLDGDATPAVDHVAMSPLAVHAFPYLFLGIVFAQGPQDALAVRFDNVTFDMKP